MDTYFKVDEKKCIGCGACVEVCGELHMSYGHPDNSSDNPRCNWCHGRKDEDGKKITPKCLVVCPYDCLGYERW